MKGKSRKIGIVLLTLLLMAAGALQASAASAGISKAKAKKIALKDAGTKASAVERLKAEADRDDGVPVYEVSFRLKGYKYEYEIRQKDGKIVGKDKELLKKKAGSGKKISSAKAKKKALSHATALTGKKLKGTTMKAEYEVENGVPVYEVEFREKKISFEYMIHARTGKVLAYDIDWPVK